jgi:AraC-like DNA-binding protein
VEGEVNGDGEEILRRRPMQRLTAQQLSRLDRLIEDKIAEEISIARLSSELGMSPSHFSHCFKRTVGISPYAFVVQRKVLAAARLAIETQESLEEIAARVGFSNFGHFRRQFRKLLGANLSDLRTDATGDSANRAIRENLGATAASFAGNALPAGKTSSAERAD